jgi:hypothetical protein
VRVKSLSMSSWLVSADQTPKDSQHRRAAALTPPGALDLVLLEEEDVGNFFWNHGAFVEDNEA